MPNIPNIPVTYATFSESVQDGDIVFVGRGSLISWLIRVITGKVWSHVGFVYRDDTGKVMMFEACPGDAKAVPLDNYKSRALGLVRAPAPFRRILSMFKNNLGTDYAYRHLLWIALRERLGIKWDYAPTELCCSELVGATLISAGIKLDWRCSPGVLAERLTDINFPIVQVTK
jgi:hypothetical protein